MSSSVASRLTTEAPPSCSFHNVGMLTETTRAGWLSTIGDPVSVRTGPLIGGTITCLTRSELAWAAYAELDLTWRYQTLDSNPSSMARITKIRTTSLGRETGIMSHFLVRPWNSQVPSFSSQPPPPPRPPLPAHLGRLRPMRPADAVA